MSIIGTKNAFFRFIKNTFIFFVGSIFSKLISFLLLPLYTSKIPASQMGEFDTNVTIFTIIASLCFFEIWTGVLRFLYSKDKKEDKAEIIASGLQIYLLSSCLFIAISSTLCIFFKYRYPALLITYMLLYMFSNLLSFIARGEQKNVDFAISGCISSVLTVSLNVLLILKFGFDYSALYISQIIGFFSQCVYLLIRDKNKHILKGLFKKTKLKRKLFIFCIPLSINTAAYWCLSGINRIVYNNIYGNEASGLFAIGSRFSSIIVLVTTCFAYAWQDLSFSVNEDQIRTKEETSILYSRGCTLYFKFLFVGAALTIPFLKVAFPFFVRGDYGAAVNLIPFFIISSLLSGFSSFLGATFYAKKETKSVFTTTVIGVITNGLLVYPFIKMFGANGANLSTIIAFIIIIIVRVYILKKKIGFQFNFGLLALFIIWSILVWFVYVYLGTRTNIALILASIPFTFFIFKKELERIRKKQ